MAASDNQLKQYQASILQKLEQVKKEDVQLEPAYLGVELADKNVLVPMLDISETLAVGDLTKVPLVKPWFWGVSNVRGVLYGVYDLGQLVLGHATQLFANTRMLLLDDEIAANVAVVVSKVMGIRKLEHMRQLNKSHPQAFCLHDDVYVDDKGVFWHVLDCRALVQSQQFVQSYI